MAGVYGVLAEDIAAEMPGLFVSGFTQASKPTLATVTSWISDADAYIDTVVTDAQTRAPSMAIDLTDLAKRYIIADVVARLYRAIYAGKATAADVVALAQTTSAAPILAQIEALVEQAVNLAVEPPTAPSVAVSYTEAPRNLLIDSTDLDRNSGYRGRF